METLIVVLFLSSIGLYIYSILSRYRTFRPLSRKEIAKFRIISKKMKADRSEEEQDFYLQTHESFMCLMAAKYFFIIVFFLLIINKIFK